MEDQIITWFVLCDDLLHQLGYRDDPQCRISTAEVMTTAFVATEFFGANFERSRCFLHEMGFIPDMVSKSQFIRRLHAIPEEIWQWFLSLLFQAAETLAPATHYQIDSFPIPVCDNIRIKRCRIYQEPRFRGKFASKRRFFYGLRIHLLLASNGQPVDFCLAPGAEFDPKVFKRLHFEDLPEGAEVYADSAYTAYEHEDLLNEAGGLCFRPMRKKRSKRAFNESIVYLQKKLRQQVEVVGSLMQRKRPAHFHAVTAKGFELKVALCVITHAVSNFSQLLTT